MTLDGTRAEVRPFLVYVLVKAARQGDPHAEETMKHETVAATENPATRYASAAAVMAVVPGGRSI